MRRKKTREPKVKRKKEKKYAWIITHILHDKLVKTIVRCDGFELISEELWLSDDDQVVALIKDWKMVERISIQEADLIQEEQSERLIKTDDMPMD